MNAKELRNKTPDQLRDELVSLKKEAFNLRFQQATGQLENTARMRTVRRDAARVKTLSERKGGCRRFGGLRPCPNVSSKVSSPRTRTSRP